jgi:hypothetical protein
MAAKLTRLTHITTAPIGRELYHLQFSLQAASPETFGYTLVCQLYPLRFRPWLQGIRRVSCAYVYVTIISITKSITTIVISPYNHNICYHRHHTKHHIAIIIYTKWYANYICTSLTFRVIAESFAVNLWRTSRFNSTIFRSEYLYCLLNVANCTLNYFVVQKCILFR